MHRESRTMLAARTALILAVALAMVHVASGATSAWAGESRCTQAKTQIEMNECAALEAEIAELAAEKAYLELGAGIEDTALAEKLSASQAAWKLYLDAQCALEGARFEGGSLQPMVVQLCRAGLAERRVEELRTFQAGAR